MPNKNITLSAHLQDSRAFGWSLRNAKYPDLFKHSANNTETPYYIRNPNEEFFEIHDLFIEHKNLLIDNLTIKAGRQKIYFGDKRFLDVAIGETQEVGHGMPLSLLMLRMKTLLVLLQEVQKNTTHKAHPCHLQIQNFGEEDCMLITLFLK